jgi:DNA-binding CsgD family transcriptional regulator
MPTSIARTEDLAGALRTLGVDVPDLLASIPDHIVVLDRKQRIIVVLGQWPVEPPQQPEDLVGKTFREVSGEHMAAEHEAAALRALQGEHTAYEWTIPKGRQPIRLSTAVAPLRNSSLRVVGLVLVTRNITSVRRDEKRLEELDRGVRQLAEVIQNYRKRRGAGQAAHERSAGSTLSQLSSRERQVLDLLGQGYRPRSIAETLQVSPETVRNHLKAMFKKTSTHSQEELIAKLRASRD